jgi:hypothetical protein
MWPPSSFICSSDNNMILKIYSKINYNDATIFTLCYQFISTAANFILLKYNNIIYKYILFYSNI